MDGRSGGYGLERRGIYGREGLRIYLESEAIFVPEFCVKVLPQAAEQIRFAAARVDLKWNAGRQPNGFLRAVILIP